MGKSYGDFMSKKCFHPGNYENRKRVWMAEQKAGFDKQKEEELAAQYKKEQDVYHNRALLGDEKAKVGLAFMYDPPPGAKRAREKEDDEIEYKFEWQRKYNAPREAYNKGDDTIRDQPFGIEVRNVRCLKCRKWGHINTDKVCELYGKSIAAEPPKPGMNPSKLMSQMHDDGIAFTKRVLSRQNDQSAANHQLIPDDVSSSESESGDNHHFFNSLSKHDRKLLFKASKKQSRKLKRSGTKKKKHKHSFSKDSSPKKHKSKHDHPKERRR